MSGGYNLVAEYQSLAMWIYGKTLKGYAVHNLSYEKASVQLQLLGNQYSHIFLKNKLAIVC